MNDGSAFLAALVLGAILGFWCGGYFATGVTRNRVCGVCDDATKLKTCGPLVCTQEGWR